MTKFCMMLTTRTLIAAIALLFSGVVSAQFHNILTHPDPVAYTCVADDAVYEGDRIIASTVASIEGPLAGGAPHVRVARINSAGGVSWEQDYNFEAGLRAMHVIPIDGNSAVLVALRMPDPANGAPARTMLIRFNTNNGNPVAVSEIKEPTSPTGDEKGLVILHGIKSFGKLILTGWLGGQNGLALPEERVAAVMSVDIPEPDDNNAATINWINGIDSPLSYLDFGDHDMGTHVVEVPDHGYFISGSANFNYQTVQGTSEHHQSILSALVDYEGTVAWAKTTALETTTSSDPRVDRHIVASSAATIAIESTENGTQIFEIAQTCNWTRNSGLAFLRFTPYGTIISLPKALHIDGAYTYSSSEITIKGYTTYRFVGATDPHVIAVSGYANDPEYLDASQATAPNDRVPFLLKLNLNATTSVDFVQAQHFYAGDPSTNYGDDINILAANSRDGQQPIVLHPEMMDLSESSTGGFNIVGHRRTHVYAGADDFDPDVILT
ncbi:MAG: hypothetical protein P8M07_00085, partial [Flavobacteriales bacterium]|nr:hypothetical protein [Flavobacteriales bacterium]